MSDNRNWLRDQMPRKDDDRPDPIAKSVLVALAIYSDRHGHSWPSQETLVVFTGYGESSIGRALQRLEEQGYIRRERVRSPGKWTSGRYAGTQYWLELGKAGDSLERNVPQPEGLAASQVTSTTPKKKRADAAEQEPGSSARPQPTEVQGDDSFYEENIRGRGDEIEILEAISATEARRIRGASRTQSRNYGGPPAPSV